MENNRKFSDFVLVFELGSHIRQYHTRAISSDDALEIALDSAAMRGWKHVETKIA